MVDFIMKIGIIGAEQVGAILGKHWAVVGHEVMLSAYGWQEREAPIYPDSVEVGSSYDTALFGHIILMAVPFLAIPEIARLTGPLRGKIVIDATNPQSKKPGDIADLVQNNPALTSSEYIAYQFREARVVKAFNSVACQVLDEQAFREGSDRIAIQMAGDNFAAKRMVAQLIRDIGFAPQDMGPLKDSRLFEPNGPLYYQNLRIHEAEAVASFASQQAFTSTLRTVLGAQSGKPSIL